MISFKIKKFDAKLTIIECNKRVIFKKENKFSHMYFNLESGSESMMKEEVWKIKKNLFF